MGLADHIVHDASMQRLSHDYVQISRLARPSNSYERNHCLEAYLMPGLFLPDSGIVATIPPSAFVQYYTN